MARRKPITVEDLWQLARAGTPSLSPDGAQAVCAVTRFDMADNSSRSTLWLLSTLGGRPRPLTQCGDKDGQPRFSPQGDRIGFIARRSQGGRTDAVPQFYVIPVDGGEAQRIGEVSTGIEAFRWCPDGGHIVFVSWVWPEARGAQAQARAAKAFADRGESGHATSAALYRHWDHWTPTGRAPHLLRMDLRNGRVEDLLAGSGYELSRADPGADHFDVSPDGRRVVFAFDPAPEKRADGRFALAELDLRRKRFEVLAQDLGWDFGAPRYSPDGRTIACLASHQALGHTMPTQLALVTPGEPVEVVSAEWDHAVAAPLLWEDDGSAVLLLAEQQGRRPLWRFDLADRRAEALVPGGWVQGFDKAAGVLVTAADAADHPVRLHAHLPGQPARRIETFNDAVMARLALGRHEAVRITGARGDPVQVWLFYPPGFDPARRYPLLQVVHGGPHAAVGDTWSYRWNNPLLAAADGGRVVALVNYHGSSGFGHAFLDSITGRWGELERQDLEAATDALLQRPYIDPARVHAAGGSYGGYLVAWLNAHAPAGRYASLVCHAGCFDWVAMFADDAWAWHARELGAWYWDDLARVQAQSPHAHAARMATPTLVVHGALDYRVPDSQGLAHYNTLKARGVPARLLWYPDENHWVQKPRNSRQWYRELLAWLGQHRGGTAPAARRPRRAVRRPAAVQPAAGSGSA